MDTPITLWQAAALAVVQGITEFVPISSSGHLILAREFFGWSGASGMTFDTVLHAGSLAAILIYFRKDLAAICRFAYGANRRELWLLAAATAPAALAGALLKPVVEGGAVRNSLVTGAAMLMTAALFMAADRKRTCRNGEMTFVHALVIGCAQVAALLPGASRSGWTIGAGVLCGYRRESAVRFSFLMAVPIIAGAIIFQLKDIVRMTSSQIEPLSIAVGLIVCFVVSLGAIHFCITYFRTHSFKVFTVYMSAVGLIAVIFGWLVS